jgi:hypothetical protein
MAVLLCLAEHLGYNVPYSYVTSAQIAREIVSSPECVSRSVKKLLDLHFIFRYIRDGVEDKKVFLVHPMMFWKGERAAQCAAYNGVWSTRIQRAIKEEKV